MSFREVSLAEVPPCHPVAVFDRFWVRAAGGRPWAPWADFDATEHPGVLSWVLLLKRESATGGSAIWRYAVCGTGCTELFGFSYQGKLFGEDLPPAAAARRRTEFDRVIAGEGPLFSHTRLPIPDKDFVQVFRGVFPFSTGAGTIDRLFVVLARDDARCD